MASLEINNLGKFADMSAVWSTHPEGGREGDYLTIGQTKFQWNVLKRRWEVAGSTTPGGSTSETIDGDLTVGGNLHVGGDAEIEGDVTINGELHLPNGDRYKGQSSYKSIVFTRSDDKPDTPAGGSYANPLPDGNVWKDGIPAGTKPVWMSSRVFTSDGKAPATSSWSTPALMSDAEDFDVEFSPAPTGSVPPAPVDGVNGNLGWLWFDPVRNPNADWGSMNWMATRSKSQGTWSDWTIFLIKGETGDGVEYVFKLTEDNDAPATPSTSDGTVNPVTGEFIPTGWTDGPTGVSKNMPYEWVSQRKRINGTWGSFTTPALWATFSEEHTVDIDEYGYWVIDGEPTDKMAIGTGVTIKGRVDVYRDSEITDSETSLESYPSSLTGDNALEIGDCWIVETGTDGNDQDVSGHLFICVATSGTLASMWKDLGEFKGEPGESSYLHIAWAQNVTFNPLVVSNPTTNPSEGRTYDWMGIKVTKTDTVPAWTQFKWNYLRGKDGMDVEYVYIRTKTNTAPTITEAAVQTSERYPDVDNYSDYAAGDIEFSSFQDDPNGVEEDWPYEWMSRREKVNGVWGQFLSPARLWSNWAPPGDPGESQPWIKTEVAQVVVDADAEGMIASPKTITLKFWLYVGKSPVMPILNRCSATYGGTTINLGQQAILSNNPFIRVTVSLPAETPLTTKDIAVTLANANASASTTVPVIINKAGANGRDVYKSIVFMRSASKPSKPQTGDYYHPVPSDTYNDGGTTRQWKDGVDAGTLPVWMTSRIFSSDNQSPPQESAWSDVALMQDTDTYDVEYTDASTESSPGTPDNPASGVTWYDPVDDASEFANRSMSWMAQRVKVVTANGTGWSNWVVNRIRGEKGNDGAGQAYVAAIPDKIVIDCNHSGQSKRAVSETIDVKLMWGDYECELKSGSTVTYSGAGSINVTTLNQGDKVLEFDFDLAANAAIQSGYIQIVLVGIDSNNVEHVAALSLPVIANTQGAKGDVGAVLRFCGPWSEDGTYVYNEYFRDCVKFGNSYYIVGVYDYTVYGQDGEPGNTQDIDAWVNVGNLGFIATELLLAENGAINLLSSNVINLFNSSGDKVASINADGQGNYVIYYPYNETLGKQNKRMEDSYDGWRYYYNDDADNTIQWMLGPGGTIIKTVSVSMSPIQLSTTTVRRLDYNLDGNDPEVTMATRYIYANDQSANNGKVYDRADLNNNEPLGSVIPDGTYAAAPYPLQDLSAPGEETVQYYLPVVVISGGKITRRYEWRSLSN